MPHILIADDSPLMRHLLHRMVEDAIPSADVAVAADGTEALTLLADRPPDVAILDVSMPGADGLRLCRAIRANARFASTGLVVITGQTNAEAGDLAREAGADHFLTKPISTFALVTAIQELAARSASPAESTDPAGPAEAPVSETQPAPSPTDVSLPEAEQAPASA